MTFFSMLSTIVVGPLKLFFEIIFQAIYSAVYDPAVSIVFLSLAMNFLVLPLYKRADAIQEQSRDIEAKLKNGITHIKKTFSGNERMMMLQTYYRQNDYSPANALKGSVSLLLEIPFFMAAYQFLSGLDTLKGAHLGPIMDLGLPDGLIKIGGLAVNLLPILMTLINSISSAIYLKGFPLKNKIQMYGIALVFLVFLYNSPSGLVFYWTLNNVFSLVKNIVTKLIKPTEKEKPARKKKHAGQTSLPAPNKKLFIAEGIFMTVLTGILIPSTYIAASPQEYVDTTYYFSPLWFIVSAFCYAAGFFLLWFSVFYWLARPKGKVIFERILLILCILAIVNYMFFGRRLGIVSSVLRYEGGLLFHPVERWVNGGVFLIITALVVFGFSRIKKFPSAVFLIASAALLAMSAMNIVKTSSSLKDLSPTGHTEDVPHFTFSKEGKNVIVMFLDRAMGEYVPYMINEKPELKEMFDGFTYYSNVISYGGHTNMGAPALMGGYEYTPVELNKRSNEALVDKHNESLKVMPVMFLNEGYNVTVFDAPYANYKWIPDMSIYDDYPKINKYISKGYFGNTDDKQAVIRNNLRNFFCFSLMKTLPLEVERLLYDGGNYLMAGQVNSSAFQLRFGLSEARGTNLAFMEPYQVLENLDTMTHISSGSDNNYVFFYNDAPHEPMMLKEPEYVPYPNIDNRAYDEAHKNRFTVDGHTIKVDEDERIIHYQSNMGVLLKVGEWLEYLKENDVYDNTRIIIVADHGYYLYQSEQFHFERRGKDIDISNYFPLLMVKDFNEHGFKVSDEFMTNADTPVLAAEDLIDDPVNPFTGKPLTDREKTAHDQFIMTSRDWNVNNNNGNVFSASTWAVIKNDIWDRNAWRFIDYNIVLTENRIPEER